MGIPMGISITTAALVTMLLKRIVSYTDCPSSSVSRHITVDVHRTLCVAQVYSVDTVCAFPWVVDLGTVAWLCSSKWFLNDVYKQGSLISRCTQIGLDELNGRLMALNRVTLFLPPNARLASWYTALPLHLRATWIVYFVKTRHAFPWKTR